MSADQFGIDPNTGQPTQMQQGPPQGPPDQPQVDPNSPPADPMLAGPTSGDQTAQEDAAEFQTRERVELQLLLAIEQCAKATMVGDGASAPQFVQAFGQTCQSLALAYQALAGIEQKENAPAAPSPFGGPQPVPNPGQAA